MAAPSKVSIFNRALNELGQDSVTSATEDSPRARAMNDVYDDVLVEVLSAHEWNESISQAQLAASSTDPVWNYDHRYALPSDFIRLTSMEWLTADYEIQGQFLLTNLDEVKITYIAKITNPVAMSPMLRKVLSLELAAAAGPRIVGRDASTLSAIDTKLQRAWDRARFLDSHQKGNRTIQSSSWISAARGDDNLLERGIDLESA